MEKDWRWDEYFDHNTVIIILTERVKYIYYLVMNKVSKKKKKEKPEEKSFDEKLQELKIRDEIA